MKPDWAIPEIDTDQLLTLATKIKVGDFSEEYVLNRIIECYRTAVSHFLLGSRTEDSIRVIREQVALARGYELALIHSRSVE